jgi:hypothetical protein
MTSKPSSFVWAVLLIALVNWPARGGEIIDRIVATVNHHIILQSDWEDAVCFEAFTAGRPLDQISPIDRKAALDRLIDQELLREQIRSSDFEHASAEEVGNRIAEIRKQYPHAEGDQAWHTLLADYGLSENQLKSRVSLQLELMRLVDSRLRPSVQIDAQSIESYYNQELLPQLRQSGAREVPLAEVTPKIKELLTQEKMNQLLTAWLQTLRSGSEIRTGSGSSTPGGQAQ